MAKPKDPIRRTNTRQDLGSIPANQHNDSSGAQKTIIVEPSYLKATLANEVVGAGRLIKVSTNSYDLKMIGRAYDPSKIYQIGDIVTQATDVYMCTQAVNTPEAFDATKWIKKAPATIASIPTTIGAVVSTGRWHNAVSVAGFLVDDDSYIDYRSIRD